MITRIGCGSGGVPDREGPARDLAERGQLDFLCFESLAERTLAQGHASRLAGTGPGYCSKLERRLRAVLPACVRNGTRILTNMGAAAPKAAGEEVARIARELGCSLKIAVVEGDDVTHLIDHDTYLPEIDMSVKDNGREVIAANAYLGAEPLVDALKEGADIVVTGRVADSSLFLAPFAYASRLDFSDWDFVARGAVVGHLLECSTQVTGGYFADPGYKDVPGLANLGFPIAEVDQDGSAVITKLAGTGGFVTPLTVKEQLLYEVHDPRSYLTPDVTANFGTVEIEDLGADRVRVSGGTGRQRPATLKVQVGFQGGFHAEAEISYAGPGAQARAELARQIIQERMRRLGFNDRFRLDLIGVNSLHSSALERGSDSQDVRLRGALRTFSREWADTFVEEIEALWISGPAGGGGFRGRVTPSVVTQPAYLDRNLISTKITYLQS